MVNVMHNIYDLT